MSQGVLASRIALRTPRLRHGANHRLFREAIQFGAAETQPPAKDRFVVLAQGRGDAAEGMLDGKSAFCALR